MSTAGTSSRGRRSAAGRRDRRRADTLQAAALDALAKADRTGVRSSLSTGIGTSRDQVGEMCEGIHAAYRLETEVVRGGQPHYP